MRISFDLDDTLICTDVVPQERRTSWIKAAIAPKWPLRAGAIRLFSGLRERRCQIWIYTTSFRSQASIATWLWAYGCKLDGVINQPDHDAAHHGMTRESVPTKNPSRFGIDLHIDDSEGVRLESLRFGFDVVIVASNDTHWVEAVLARVDVILAKRGPREV